MSFRALERSGAGEGSEWQNAELPSREEIREAQATLLPRDSLIMRVSRKWKKRWKEAALPKQQQQPAFIAPPPRTFSSAKVQALCVYAGNFSLPLWA